MFKIRKHIKSHNQERSIRLSTIPKFHKSELQGYKMINVYRLNNTNLGSIKHSIKVPSISLKTVPTFRDNDVANITEKALSLPCPIVNKTFSKHNSIDWSILHRRLDHISDENLAKMCKDNLLQDQPHNFPSKFRNH